nr:hypothetical protein [Tanacetum cinerariifolium]
MDEYNVEVSGSNVLGVFVAHYVNFLGTNMLYDDLNVEALFQKKVLGTTYANMLPQVTDMENKGAMFNIGELSVKYIGVPFILSRLLNKNCKILVEKLKTESGIGRINLFRLQGDFSFNWPQSWLLKAPDNRDAYSPNVSCWRDINGKFLSFSVKRAWEAIRPRGIKEGFLRRQYPLDRVSSYVWLVDVAAWKVYR